MNLSRAAALALFGLVLAGCGPPRRDVIVVGSKNFPEQEVLGELLAQHIAAVTGLPVERRFYLSGTYICQQAILAGRIDVYVEYTGTALEAVLKEHPQSDNPQAVYERVKSEYARRFHLVVTPSLGFQDSFAIVVRGTEAQRLHLKTISQMVPFAPRWRAGFGYEFMERQDGYQGFVKAYHLRFAGPPRIMDLGLLYRALISKQVDVVAGNSTDGVIDSYGLVILQDDKHYFPPYQAVPVVREQTIKLHPQVYAALMGLAGKISVEEMRKMNYQVVAKHRPARVVVEEFRKAHGL